MANEYKIAVVITADDQAGKVLQQLADKTGNAANALKNLDVSA